MDKTFSVGDLVSVVLLPDELQFGNDWPLDEQGTIVTVEPDDYLAFEVRFNDESASYFLWFNHEHIEKVQA